MTSLYALGESFRALESLFSDDDRAADVDDVMIAAAWGAQTEALEVKAERTALWLLTNDADAEAAKAEGKRLIDLAGQRKHRSDVVRGLLKSAMEAAHTTRIDRPLAVVSIRKNGGVRRLEIFDDRVPEKYRVVVPATTRIDKEALRASAEVGATDGDCTLRVDVDGEPFAVLHARGTSLVIK